MSHEKTYLQFPKLIKLVKIKCISRLQKWAKIFRKRFRKPLLLKTFCKLPVNNQKKGEKNNHKRHR